MAYSQRYYGQCDSYFVDDEQTFANAERSRERARQIAKEHQKALGLELSRMTADEYQEDCLDHMEVMEVRTCLSEY